MNFRKPEQDIGNPYVASQKAFFDVFNHHKKQARIWMLFAFVSMLTSIGSISFAVWRSSQSTVEPFVVEVDKTGDTSAIARAVKYTEPTRSQIKSELARFITNWRTVTFDANLLNQNVTLINAKIPRASNMLNIIREEYEKRNPWEIAKNESIHIQITNILPLTEKTWVIEWQEKARSIEGELLRTEEFKANLTIQIVPPKKESDIINNPIGLFVVDMAYAKKNLSSL